MKTKLNCFGLVLLASLNSPACIAVPDDRGELLELGPKTFTFLVTNYYSIRRTADTKDTDVLEAILVSMRCDASSENIIKLRRLVKDADSPAVLSRDVETFFSCS